MDGGGDVVAMAAMAGAVQFATRRDVLLPRVLITMIYSLRYGPACISEVEVFIIFFPLAGYGIAASAVTKPKLKSGSWFLEAVAAQLAAPRHISLDAIVSRLAARWEFWAAGFGPRASMEYFPHPFPSPSPSSPPSPSPGSRTTSSMSPPPHPELKCLGQLVSEPITLHLQSRQDTMHQPQPTTAYVAVW